MRAVAEGEVRDSKDRRRHADSSETGPQGPGEKSAGTRGPQGAWEEVPAEAARGSQGTWGEVSKKDAGPQGDLGEKSAEAESGSQGTASKETGSPVLTATKTGFCQHLPDPG